MESCHRPRLIIAAVHSGSGKTTITAGILAGLRESGKVVQAYKIGPDYIDPGFHRLASRRPTHNLDSWLVPEETLRSIFAQTSKAADISVIEGVMGLYDGGRGGISSTASIAKLLNAPVLLVIDIKSMADSAAAIALGFKKYDPEVLLAGVILNRAGSESHGKMVEQALKTIGIPVWGIVRRDAALTLPERHLGLTPAAEEKSSQKTMEKIKKSITDQVQLEQLVQIADSAPDFSLPKEPSDKRPVPKVKIGVASDEAFSFYYPESLAVLEKSGAQIQYFSPLRDSELPNVDGLLIGGGFPEMFAAQLDRNKEMRQAIYTAGKKGMPIYAECGGLMYLTQGIRDFSGQIYKMSGLIPAYCHMHEKLQTVGYIQATALQPSILCETGDQLKGHEFHFSSMELLPEHEGKFPWAFTVVKMRTGKEYMAGYADRNILASYIHIHFAGNPKNAERLIEHCLQYAKRQEREQ